MFISLRHLCKVFTFIVLLGLNGINSANILFLFGGGNMSHKMGVWPLVTTLADRGHNVTFISSTAKQPVAHSKVIDVVPIAWRKFMENAYQVDRLKDRIEGTNWDTSAFPYEDFTLGFCKLTIDAIESEPSFKNIVQNGNYELVFISALFNECGFLLADHFGAKTVVYDTTMLMPWFHGIYGIPMEQSWVPFMDARGTHPMNFFERMRTAIKYYSGYSRSTKFYNNMQELYKTRFNKTDVPGFADLERNASLVFINSHHSTDFARSLPPMFVNIGGMQCWDPVGKLPKNFQDYMDGAEDGVILITFGSTIDLSSLSEHFLTMFFNTMRKYSTVRFIWRWDGAMPEGHPENILASKWLPQREILDHRKTIGFMTHCGMSSIHEATFHGVPLIALPLFVDQDLSAYRVEAQELGVRLEARELTQEVMDSAFGEIIFNPKYRKNMEIRSKIFRDRPRSPIEEAVFWTEFVLRNDDFTALKPMLLGESYWTRTSTDVYLAFLLLSVIAPLIVFLFIRKIFKYLV